MEALLITLGNSEIQFDQNHLENFSIIIIDRQEYLTKGDIKLLIRKNNRINKENWFVPFSSRDGGKYIIDHYPDFQSIIQYPILDPIFKIFDQDKISKIILVATDQEDPIHRQGDTLYYAEIVSKYLLEYFNHIQVKVLLVKNDLRNIDKQYAFFKENLNSYFSEIQEWDKIHLFAQGGIDQINHAITLQLIQLFKSKLYLWQKPEDDVMSRLVFPLLFLRDLTRQKVIKHLEDFDFRKSATLLFDNLRLETLANYLADRLALLHEDIIFDDFIKEWDSKTDIEKRLAKIQDLTYSFKIDIKQNLFNEAVTKLYTIYENIFKWYIDDNSATDTLSLRNGKLKDGDKNEPWEEFLKNKFDEKIIDWLYRKKPNLSLTNPNAMTYFYLVRYLIEKRIITFITDTQVKQLHTILDDLRETRNQINHNMGSCTKEKFGQILKNRKMDIHSFMSFIDVFTHTNDMGIYGHYQTELLSMVNSTQ